MRNYGSYILYFRTFLLAKLVRFRGKICAQKVKQ